MSAGRVSVIMVSYHTGPILSEALEAAASDPSVDEVILVDNGNSHEDRITLCETAARLGKVRLLQGHGNIGFARACNYGAEMAQGKGVGEGLLFLNPDAVMESGSARSLMEARTSTQRPWIAGGLIVDETGEELRGSRRGELTFLSALTAFLPFGRFFPSARFDRSSEPMPSEPVPMPTVSGAFLMTDRESFDQLGGFDEAYFLHVEDIALCREARRQGGSVIFVPTARARHEGATSKASAWTVERHKLNGFLRYFWTGRPGFTAKLATILIAPLLIMAMTGRMLIRTLRERA